MIIKELFDFVWEKVPWWAKWPVVIVCTPTFLIWSFLTWHTTSVQGMIRPYEEKRDLEMINLVDKIEAVHDKIGSTNAKIDSVDRKLDILIQRR